MSEWHNGINKVLLNRFLSFHKENPKIYELFIKYAIEAKNAGRPRFSQVMIINRIRWYSVIETRGDDYKLNNDFIALYVRMFLSEYPHYGGFFKLNKMGKRKR